MLVFSLSIPFLMSDALYIFKFQRECWRIYISLSIKASEVGIYVHLFTLVFVSSQVSLKFFFPSELSFYEETLTSTL